MIIILGMMQVSKKIPFDDPQVLMGVRALYIFSNVLILGIYLYIQQQINKKKGAVGDTKFLPAKVKLLTRMMRGRPDDAQVRRTYADG